MRALFTVFLLCLVITISIPVKAQDSIITKPGWKLVWNDEFSSDGMPDTTYWFYEHGPNWYNEELQYYTNGRKENVYVKDGYLVLETRHEKYGERDYTSTRMNSVLGWTYGRMEIRAKLPKGNGLWPAIWMLPVEWKYGGWPKSGEIDIMENWSRDQERVLGTVHTEAYNHVIGTAKGGAMSVAEPWKNFYTYSIEWIENQISFFIDDSLYYNFQKEDGAGSDKWPFDIPFRFLLNIAVESFTPGQEHTWEKRTMEIDFVRVFGKE